MTVKIKRYLSKFKTELSKVTQICIFIVISSGMVGILSSFEDISVSECNITGHM